jgi:4-amino-4-deoxy-L-arabinose transferase-like glycosyltransferase
MQKLNCFFRNFISGFSASNYFILLEIIFLCVYAYVFDYKVFMGGDNAEYYITGHSLALGKGYSNIDMLNDPPANHFSPGYPFIISIIIRIFGDSMIATQLGNGVFLAGAILLLFQIVKELTKDNKLAFVISLLTLLNAHLLFYAYITMSEIPFTFFLLLSVWLFIKTFSRGSTLRQPYFWLLILSLIITFYIKSGGIALIGASIIILLVNKRWYQAMILPVIFLAAYMPWYIRTENLGGNVYAKQVQMVNPYNAAQGKLKLADYPKRFLENAGRYLSREIPSAVFGYTIQDYNSKTSWKDYLAGVLLLFFLIAGIFSLAEYKWFFVLTIGGFFFILLLWPPLWNGVRFMIPLIPLLLFLIVQGILFVLRKLIKKISFAKKYFQYAPFLFLLIIPSPIAQQIKTLHIHSKAGYYPSYDNYFKLATWCKENLPANAVIACRKPGLFYLFAHRKVTNYTYTENGKQLIDDLKKNGVTYVVLDDLGFASTQLYLWPAMMNNQESFESVKAFGNNYLARVRY